MVLVVTATLADDGLPLDFGFSIILAGSALTILVAGALASAVPARRLLPCFGGADETGSS